MTSLLRCIDDAFFVIDLSSVVTFIGINLIPLSYYSLLDATLNSTKTIEVLQENINIVKKKIANTFTRCHMHARSVKKKTPIYFNRYYRREMNLVPIIMDYCLFQFDALKFFLGVRLHGGVSI